MEQHSRCVFRELTSDISDRNDWSLYYNGDDVGHFMSKLGEASQCNAKVDRYLCKKHTKTAADRLKKWKNKQIKMENPSLHMKRKFEEERKVKQLVCDLTTTKVSLICF